MLGFMPSRTVILCFISLYGPRISSSWLPRSLPQMASSTGRPTRQQPTTSSREKLSSRVQAAAAARRKPLLRYKIWSHSRHLPHHHCLSSRCLLSNSIGMAAVSSVHDFIVKDASGKDVHMSSYKGKVLLIVNVASKCGLTNSNYAELGELYEMYKDQGFEILAFPCNQFGGQEPGTNEEIIQFVCTRFKAKYPIFDKVDVNGEDAAPIYKFLKSSKTGPYGDNIKWNFAKFLIDQQGRVVERYAPTTYPLSIQKDIKKLLGNF